MDFLEHVTKARSYRRFQADKALPEGTLSWLVDCARLTPSAGNLQPLRYLCVGGKETCKAFYPSLAWAGYLKDWDGPEEHERPTGYIVILTPRTDDGKTSVNTYIDLGIAGQTIQLAAASKGIAACMFRTYIPKKMAEAITLPPDHEILMVIAFGYPVEDVRIAPIGEDGSIKYYRDQDKVHFVPKRALKDVLLGSF